MKAILLLTFLFISSSFGLTIINAVDSPKVCPEDLSITSRILPDQKEMVEFSVQFETGSSTQRKAAAFLKIEHNSEFLARVSISPEIKGKTYTFTIEMSRKAAEESSITLSSYLCDDSGLVVIGGGQIFEINLAGLLPSKSKIVD